MSKLIRVSDQAYDKLSEIAQKGGFSRQEIIDQAIKKLERDTLLKQANEAYAAINNDPKKWLEEQKKLTL